MRIFSLLLLILIAAGVAVQSPGMQQRLAEQAVERFAGKLGAGISFSSLSIQSPGSVMIRDLLITDGSPVVDNADTILSAKEFFATVSPRMLLKNKEIQLERLDLNGASVLLVSEIGENGERTDNFSRVLSSGEKSDSASTFGMGIKRIGIRNFRFRYVDAFPKKAVPKGAYIDYDDIDARASVISARDFSIKDGYYAASVGEADLTEKCGLHQKVSGRFRIGHRQAIIRDIHIQDEVSDFHAPLYSMTSMGERAYKYYCSKVRMRLRADRGTLGWSTIKWYAGGALPKSDFLLKLDCIDAEGYVNDLDIKKIRFTDLYGGIETEASGRITGITITPDLMIKAKVNRMSFTTPGVQKFLSAMAPEAGFDASSYAAGERFELKADATGRLNALSTNASLRSGRSGRAQAALRIDGLRNSMEGTLISGTLSAKNLDCGKLLGKDFLGSVTANTGFKASLGADAMSVRVDSLMVDRLSLLGYDYTGLAAAGTYSGNAFDGKIICADPNLNFIFQGIFNLSPKTNNALYKFSANVGYADLEALHLDTRGGSSKISLGVNSNFMKIPRGDLLGDINISDLTLENDNGMKYIGDIYVGSHANGDINRLQFQSSFLDAGYVGNRSVARLLDDLQSMVTRRELPSLYSSRNPDRGDASGRYDISINFHDSRDLLSFIEPGFYIADSTSIELRTDGSGLLHAHVKSPRLAYRANYLKGLDISLDNLGGSANATLLTDEMMISKIGFRNSAFTAFAQKDEFFLSFHYDNIAGLDNMGELYLGGSISRDASDTLSVNAKPLSSYVKFEDSQWDIAESDIVYRAGEARFDNFLIRNGRQSIAVNGGVSTHKSDTLTLVMNELDLGTLNYFTERDFSIRGLSTGRAMLSSPLKGSMRAMVNLACDSLKVGGEDAGSLKMAALWDSAEERISAFLRNVTGGTDAVNLRASYGTADKSVNAEARLNELNLALLAPFLPAGLDIRDGSISGEFTAGGTLDSLSLGSSGARVVNARVLSSLNNVAYRLDGPFSLNDDALNLDSFGITDEEGGHAALQGGLIFNGFRQPLLDASAKLSNLKLMGMNSGEGAVYGNLFASGDARISGPLNSILLDADLYTNKAGNLHVALGSSSASGTSDLLTFTDHSVAYVDPYDLMLGELMQIDENRRRQTASNFMARCRIMATPDLEAVLELDNAGSNYLTAMGSGLITIDAEPSRNIFDISGDYNIANGRYHFSLPGIVNKNFNINSGSSIKFGGDILDSELDIDASYTLRTSINGLLADTTSVATRRMVNCGIGINGRISSPQVEFSIDIPDLDPATKSQVESALNTEDKVQKQFLSLVIAGAFLQTEQSGIVNNTDMVFSNVSEMMSRQLSELLYKMDIPIDLGVGYQQNATGTDLYDVSVSTELFDSRVEVHGSVGNRQYSRTTNPNGEVVGDLDIDVKLDRPGQIRLNLFSHSADEYTSYLDYSQRNGVGITYQKEFNRWKDLRRSLFSSRRKRQEAEREEAINEEKTIIEVKEND